MFTNAPEEIRLDDFTNVSLNENYFLFSLNNLKQLDLNKITDDNVVVFPRNVYLGQVLPPPIDRQNVINPNTLYVTGDRYPKSIEPFTSYIGGAPYDEKKFRDYPDCKDCNKEGLSYGQKMLPLWEQRKRELFGHVHRDFDGYTWENHPPYTSMYRFNSWKKDVGCNKNPKRSEFCPFGYCYGPQSGRNYAQGRLI